MKSKKKVIKIVALCLIVAILSSVTTLYFCGYLFVSSDKQKMLAKANTVYNLIEKNFLFDYDESKISDFMITGMLASLDDKYANYYKNDIYDDKKMNMEGHTYGIGISAIAYENGDNGLIKIVQIHEKSPAEEVGLQVGDIITNIDDNDLKEYTYEEAINLVKGEEGSFVNLTVLRDNSEIKFNVERKDVELTSVISKNIDGVGYVKITDFNESTSKQFEEKVDKLVNDGVKGLVFDLRNNSGGTMVSVLDMLDYLLPKGPTAKVTDKNGKEEVYGYSDDECIDLPMVTLTNGNTASASELFVQTLKDYEKAKSVGEKTFGKGIIQTNYELYDDSGVKFTTGYFSGPYSENFHGKGINPDVEVKLSDDNYKKLLENELSIEEDVQLQKAIEMLMQDIK